MTDWSSVPTTRGTVRIPDWLDLEALAELAASESDEQWRNDARCLVPDGSPDALHARWALFYLDKIRPARADYGPADAFCQACPVRLDCLAAHLYDRDAYAGGTTPPERRRILRALHAHRAAAA